MKRECPPSFFEEDDDEDYLIQASIENEKENDPIGFDEFMSHKPAVVKPGNEQEKIQSNPSPF